MTRPRYYRLVNGEPVPCPELDFLNSFPQAGEIPAFMEQVKRDHALLREVWSDEHRRVASTRIGGVHVSTVFLVIDHAFRDDGPPVLFETMVLGGFFDGLQRRYCTRDAALAGHAEVVQHLAQFRYMPTWAQNALRRIDDFFEALPYRMRRYVRDCTTIWMNRHRIARRCLDLSQSACAQLWNRIRRPRQ